MNSDRIAANPAVRVGNLASVISTHELEQRPARTPDYEAEVSVLLGLAETMARAPQHLLQQLVDDICELCQAGSAGISLLDPAGEGGEPSFRWVATAGRFTQYTGNTVARSASPCGRVLDINQMVMMSNPVRYYPQIDALSEPVSEVLLFPYYRDGKAIGTVWVASHSDERKFDREDARLVRDLSRFAAAAVDASAKAETHAKLQADARAVAEREVTRLEEVNRRVLEADRGKAEFLATLGHELRNAIGPLANGMVLLRRSADPEVHQRTQEMMERQMGHVSHLVDDLLDSARVSAGKIRLQLTPLDLNVVVRQAVEMATSRIAASGQTVELSLLDTPLMIQGDVQRLNQVFSNLLDNAAKYGRPDRAVAVSVARSGNEAIVTVRDEGIGIDSKMLPRVFELFVQTERSLGRSQGGLGIGLGLVHRLVELHGGHVAARSEGPGLGSEFSVCLPLAPREVRACGDDRG